MAGHKCVGFCEFDRFARASYISMYLLNDEQRARLAAMDMKQRQQEILKNEYLNGEWCATDIRDVDAGIVPRADLWCFGAPCQSFSVAGKRAGLDGQSGLIREVFRILGETREEDRPEWLIYENVKGMFSSNHGLDFLCILLEMDGLGYDCQWQNFNSKDWGVPQNRERIYTIGHLRAKGAAKIFPIEGAGGENSLEIMQIGQLYGTEDETQVYGDGGEIGTLSAPQSKESFKVAIPFLIDKNIGGKERKVANTIRAREDCGVGNFKQQGTAVCVPIGCIDLQGRQGKKVEPSEDAPTLRAQSHGNEPLIVAKVDVIDDTYGYDGTRVYEEESPTIRSDRRGLKVAIPVLTPDRVEKRQNGRRFKENGDPSFTLTAQDRHGVAIGIELDSNAISPELIGGIGKKNFGGKWPRGNRIYDGSKAAVALTASPVGAAGNQTNLYAVPIGGICSNASKDFHRGILDGASRCLKGEKHDSSVALGILRDVRSQYGKAVRKQYESGEISAKYAEMKESEVRSDGMTNTLTTFETDNLLAVRVADGEDGKEHPGLFVELYEDCVVYAVWYEKYQCYVAIRKLTPRECFRLQALSDADFDRAAFVNSDSQLYKQAGNSITANIAYVIGEKLAEVRDGEKHNGKGVDK